MRVLPWILLEAQTNSVQEYQPHRDQRYWCKRKTKSRYRSRLLFHAMYWVRPTWPCFQSQWQWEAYWTCCDRRKGTTTTMCLILMQDPAQVNTTQFVWREINQPNRNEVILGRAYCLQNSWRLQICPLPLLLVMRTNHQHVKKMATTTMVP